MESIDITKIIETVKDVSAKVCEKILINKNVQGTSYATIVSINSNGTYNVQVAGGGETYLNFINKSITPLLVVGDCVVIKYSQGNMSNGYISEKMGYDNGTIPFIAGTQTSATGSWTGISNLETLHDGQQIAYWLPYNGSGNATLDLTLANGTTTGAINCYYSGSGRVTTQYDAGNIIKFTYRKDVSINGSSTKYTGWWNDAQYYSDNQYSDFYYGYIKVRNTITANFLIVGNDDGYCNIGAGVSFNINYPILLSYANMTTTTKSINNYIGQINIYVPSMLSTFVGIQGEMIYLKGTLVYDTFTIASSDWLTCTPTANDGYTYIALGLCSYTGSSTNTNYLRLQSSHPILTNIDYTMTQTEYNALVTLLGGGRKRLIDWIYPVGHIIESTNANFNPNRLYVGTTWKKIEGRFMLGSSSSYSLGDTGGSADAVIPSHNHSYTLPLDDGSSGLFTDIRSSKPASFTHILGGLGGTYYTGVAGVSGTGKNMPPYKVVNIWERTA